MRFFAGMMLGIYFGAALVPWFVLVLGAGAGLVLGAMFQSRRYDQLRAEARGCRYCGARTQRVEDGAGLVCEVCSLRV